MMQARLTSMEINLDDPNQQAANRLLTLTPAFFSSDLATNGLWGPGLLFASTQGKFSGRSFLLGPARALGRNQYCVTSISICPSQRYLRVRSLIFSANGTGQTVADDLLSAICWLENRDNLDTLSNSSIKIPRRSFFPVSGVGGVDELHKPSPAVRHLLNTLAGALLSFGKPVKTFTAAVGVKRDCGARFQLYEDQERSSDIRFWKGLHENFERAQQREPSEPLVLFKESEAARQYPAATSLQSLLQQALQPGNFGAIAAVFSILLVGQNEVRSARQWISQGKNDRWLPLVAKIEALNLLGLAPSSHLEELLRQLLPEPLQCEVLTKTVFNRQDFQQRIFEELVYAQDIVTTVSLKNALGRLIADIDATHGLEGRASALSHMVNSLTLVDRSHPSHVLPSLAESLRLIASICDPAPTHDPSTGKPEPDRRSRLRLVTST